MVFDTTAGSVVHSLYRSLHRIWPKGEFVGTKLYISVILITVVPLLLFALVFRSHIPLINQTYEHTLPMFLDFNIWFLLLVSLPCLLILTATDQKTLNRSLEAVQSNGTLTIPPSAKSSLVKDWRKRFLKINIFGQLLGIAVGFGMAFLIHQYFSDPKVKYWIADKGSLVPVGWVYLGCIFLFYALLTIYIVRVIAISLLLKNVVAQAKLQMLPLHPDSCGGLRRMGEIGLRNQYALMFLGINVVLFLLTDYLYLNVSRNMVVLMAAAVVAYLTIGPFVFVAPLLPFRTAMEENKSQLISPVVERIKDEIGRLRANLSSATHSKEDGERIEELSKIRDTIEALPVWPFDANTLTKFFTAYLIPIIIPLVGAVYFGAKEILDLLVETVPSHSQFHFP